MRFSKRERELREAFEKDREYLCHTFYHRIRAYCCTIVGSYEAWDLCEEEEEKRMLHRGSHQSAMRMIEFLDAKICEFEEECPPVVKLPEDFPAVIGARSGIKTNP